MKSLFRSPPVQSVLAFIIWLWMAIIGRTVRWRTEGLENARELWEQEGGLIVAGWHSRILLLPTGWNRHVRKWRKRPVPPAMLISLSREGEFVARAIRWLGLKPIRGSATNKRKRKDKGGVQAVRASLEHLRAGGAICITPDGPRGPRQRAGLGPILLAQRSGAPILVYTFATAPSRRMKTWDRFLIPFPFTKGAIIFGDVIRVARGEDTEAARLRLESALNAATRRAEELVGAEVIEPADAPNADVDAMTMAAE